ncbi:MAG: T9SS C-terminal target domain-containing protein [Ignavibacteriae bacterium]|nr:MAG: T9SS C-terminal target domain-containing protein [Ignavibacteriota bacterium]
MAKLILSLLFLFPLTAHIFSQSDNAVVTGSFLQYQNVNGNIVLRTVTNPAETGNYSQNIATPPVVFQNSPLNNSMVRWSFTDPIAIGDRNATSGTGLYEVTGWGLNTQRVSLYNNESNNPLWEYMTDPTTFTNNVAISDTGGVIASASHKQILAFNRTSSTPILNYNLSSLPISSAVGSAIDITNNGTFIIAGTSPSIFGDSSYILGIYKDSAQPSWKIVTGQTGAGGSGIQGIRICGNDSLAIVNTYGGFYIIRTYTGQIIYQGLINPSSNNGTQSPQAISGDGNYIATINYNGFVRVYQRSGNTYNFLWTHQEPPGIYYNWMTTVDISNNGQYLACGTLNFLSSSSYDGKVKLFRTTNSTPIWTYGGFGDEVQCVAFSKNGNVLVAASWGDLNNANNDMVVWKVSSLTNIPIFAVNAVGSSFWCSISNDGSTVTASGKKVHARTFGNGGEVYNMYIDTNDAPVGVINNNNIPYEYNLNQNYPNPFNPKTIINYQLAAGNYVRLIIYDVMGRETAVLVNQKQNAGTYEIEWDASNYPSGVYFYKLEAGDFVMSKKMVLIK